MQENKVEEIKIGDKIRIGERIGEVIKITQRNETYIFKVAFPEDSPKDFVAPPTKIEKIYSPLEKLQSATFSSLYDFDLHFESIRLSLAYNYDHLLSLSFTRTNLEPYQVEAVHKVLNAYKHRFLIADDVGLGKTIEAGIVLKELSLRGFAKRILVVVPASLRFQWHRELKERFDENFIIYDSSYINSLKQSLPKDVNVWEVHSKIITSLDYAKREDVLVELERAKWDVIIFDEAHKLSASKYGNEIKRSQRYKLAQDLQDKTESLLLLTATPHKGDSFAFYTLLSLINPYIFENENKIISSRLNEIMIRRGKDGIFDSEGKPVFKPRQVTTVPVIYTEKEKELYESVTFYVQEYFNLAKAEKNRAVGFAMVLLQKRMVSSIAAIRSSLKNRLVNLLTNPVSLTKEEEIRLRDYLEDPDSIDDWEKERLEKKIETISLQTTPEGLKEEISVLQGLVTLSDKIDIDSKGETLLQFVKGILEKDPQEKILIFTEYRDTLNYLKNLLKDYNPLVIHGGMNMNERKEAEEYFKSPSFNILIGTEAAGEGINLQFCHIMVNYDLPWNPNRIDQRIGRLHRYGQKRDVKVYNLFVTDTREGIILARLMEKVSLIEKELGGKISEIVGFILEGMDIQNLIMEAISENKPPEVSIKNLEQAIEDRKKAYETIEKFFLMDLRKFDLEETLKVIKKSEQKSASEQEIERFVRAFLNRLNGKIEPTRKKLVYRITTPKEILKEGIKEEYDAITFSKKVAKDIGEKVEFIAFGHPLLEAIIEYCKDKNHKFGGRTTVKLTNKFQQAGLICNFLLGFDDATGKTIFEEILPVFVSIAGKTYILSPKDIPEFLESPFDIYQNKIENIKDKIFQLYEKAYKIALEKAKEFCGDVQKKKSREIKIKKVDVQKFFSSRIEEEQKKIEGYQQRLKLGEEMEIAIRSSKKKIDDLELEFNRTLQKLEEEEIVIERDPELLSVALIIPENEPL